MTNHKPNGGPAFPEPTDFCPGMTLRDWFAGQALARIGPGNFGWTCEMIATDCYRQADAMLAERDK